MGKTVAANTSVLIYRQPDSALATKDTSSPTPLTAKVRTVPVTAKGRTAPLTAKGRTAPLTAKVRTAPLTAKVLQTTAPLTVHRGTCH